MARILSYDAGAVIDHLAKEEAVFSKLPKARYVTDRADLMIFRCFRPYRKKFMESLRSRSASFGKKSVCDRY